MIKIILEMRAGTGGDRSGYFRGRYVQNVHHVFQNKGWRHEVTDSSEASKGYKELVMKVERRRRLWNYEI